MKAIRQYNEMKDAMKTIGRMIEQPTTDRLSMYMGAAVQQVEMSKFLSFGQKATLNRLIADIYRELREEAEDNNKYIETTAPAGILELLFGT